MDKDNKMEIKWRKTTKTMFMNGLREQGHVSKSVASVTKCSQPPTRSPGEAHLLQVCQTQTRTRRKATETTVCATNIVNLLL